MSALPSHLDPAKPGNRNISTCPAAEDLSRSSRMISRDGGDRQISQIDRLRQAAWTLCPDSILITEERAWKVSAKLHACCANVWLGRDSTTGELTYHMDRCRHRVCPRCAGLRAMELRQKMLAVAQQMDAPKFLTLTLKHSNDGLREQIKRLTTSFAKLRRSAEWKARVAGGFYTLEIAHNRRDDQWHPHLHVVMDSEWYDLKTLKTQWLAITGDSNILHIEAVNSRKSIAKYVTDYVTKGTDGSTVPQHRLCEWLEAVTSLRFCQTFGTVHGVKLNEEEEDAKPESERILPLEALPFDAEQGKSEAAEILDLIQHDIATNGPRRLHEPGPALLASRVKLAKRVRDWASTRNTGTDPDDTPGHGPRHSAKRGRDRTVGLWQEPDKPHRH